MLGIQLGLGSYASVRGVSPNLLLLMVIFISLNAPREQAMLGGFLLGAMQDLITLQPLGLFAFCYGTVAMLVAWSAQFVRRTHPLTQLFMTLGSSLLVGLILMIHGWVRPIPLEHGGIVVGTTHIGPRVLLVSTLYTTGLSPVVITMLQQTRGFFAFESTGRRRNRV